MKQWREIDFKTYILGNSLAVRAGQMTREEQAERFKKAMNVDEIEIVHDPTLANTVKEVPKPGPKTAEKIQKIQRGRAKK